MKIIPADATIAELKKKAAELEKQARKCTRVASRAAPRKSQAPPKVDRRAKERKVEFVNEVVLRYGQRRKRTHYRPACDGE